MNILVSTTYLRALNASQFDTIIAGLATDTQEVLLHTHKMVLHTQMALRPYSERDQSVDRHSLNLLKIALSAEIAHRVLLVRLATVRAERAAKVL